MLTHAKLCQPQGFPVVGLGDHRVTGTVIHWTQCECPALGLPGVSYLGRLADTRDSGNISQRGWDTPEVTVYGDPRLMLSQVMGDCRKSFLPLHLSPLQSLLGRHEHGSLA